MLTVTVAAVLITALIAAYGGHKMRRAFLAERAARVLAEDALLAERAARVLTEGALHRDATRAVTTAQDAVVEAQRVLLDRLLPDLALEEAEQVIDRAYSTTTSTTEGDSDA